jgi:hypothetical protein
VADSGHPFFCQMQLKAWHYAQWYARCNVDAILNASKSLKPPGKDRQEEKS